MPEVLFLWENETWEFSNSDNSRKSDENQGKKSSKLEAAATNSNCPTPKTAGEPATGKKRSKKSEGVDGQAGKKVITESDHEMHIWTERERRKRMRSMFVDLHAMLPQLPPKVPSDKWSIVDEAVRYIKTLQQSVKKLEKQKEDKVHGIGIIDSREAFLADYQQGSASTIIPSLSYLLPRSSPSTSGFPPVAVLFRTWVSPNVILSISGGDNAHINVCCVKKLGLLTAITYFLEKHNLEVVSFQASSDNYRTMSMYMIHAKPSGALYEHVSHEICSFEEKFQQAAADIMTYITSLQ